MKDFESLRRNNFRFYEKIPVVGGNLWLSELGQQLSQKDREILFTQQWDVNLRPRGINPNSKIWIDTSHLTGIQKIELGSQKYFIKQIRRKPLDFFMFLYDEYHKNKIHQLPELSILKQLMFERYVAQHAQRIEREIGIDLSMAEHYGFYAQHGAQNKQIIYKQYPGKSVDRFNETVIRSHVTKRLTDIGIICYDDPQFIKYRKNFSERYVLIDSEHWDYKPKMRKIGYLR